MVSDVPGDHQTPEGVELTLPWGHFGATTRGRIVSLPLTPPSIHPSSCGELLEGGMLLSEVTSIDLKKKKPS